MGKCGERNTSPCDGCALRRVRCDGVYPCSQCTKRELSCTFLRPRLKRGPKGIRAEPARKVHIYQSALRDSLGEDLTPIAPPASSESEPGSLRVDATGPLQSYFKFLRIYHLQLHHIWPVVSTAALVQKLKRSDDDHESHALAAALCAATIGQLRLPEHNTDRVVFDSCRLEREAQRHRSLFDYRESGSLDSLLTSFFLHIYWANSGKLQTSGMYLREAISYAHRFTLHRPELHTKLESTIYELQLRIYWMLFMSERTFCVQNNYHPVLTAIDEFPCPNATVDSETSSIPAFVALAQVFTYLHEDILRCSGPDGQGQEPKLGHDVVSFIQRSLGQDRSVVAECNETQRVDIVVTRQWLRMLLWHYTVTNFQVYCNSASNMAFSTFLPAIVARDLLSDLSSPSLGAIRAHGYGMELKIFKVADSLLDVLACSQLVATKHDTLESSFDSLQGLEKILLMVGGPTSIFLNVFRQRLAEVQPHNEVIERCLPLPSPDTEETALESRYSELTFHPTWQRA